MRRLIDIFLTLLIPITILFDLFLAPYTKVEESFSIQATHDILTYGIPWTNASTKLPQFYDHLTFPGSVPRTFVGPVALAGASWPWVQIFGHWDVGARGQQVVVRAVLGLFNAICMIVFREGVAKSFGRNAANFYAVFQASEFHMMYYASRTLPNFFAFGLTTLALRNLLPLAGRSPSSRIVQNRFGSALTLLTIAGVIFRSEIALLLACHTIYLLLAPHIRLPIRSAVFAGFLGLTIGLVLTIPIDTFFWRSRDPLWPELRGFIYNVVEGKAENWGTQSRHFYFTSALPRLLFNPMIYQVCLPFAILTFIIRRPALDVLVPNLAFVTIYSFQPHKEWRFIVYIIPPLLAIAGAGASWIWTRRSKKFSYRILALGIVASSLASFAASGVMLAVSRLNYPGADGLNRLHDFGRNDSGEIRVHLDTLACTTGVTHFLEERTTLEQGRLWLYDRTEDEKALLDPFFWHEVNYALVEEPERVPGNWLVLDTIESFGGVQFVRVAERDKWIIRTEFQDLWDTASEVIGAIKHIWADKQWNPRLVETLVAFMQRLETSLKVFVTERITNGWWMQFRMVPRLRILKKETPTFEEMLEASNRSG